MARIFISYKRVDKEKVFKIKKRLESALGIECWIDLSGIESDAQFTNVIIKAIRECEIVLFMYSKAHGNIENVEKDWTTRELNFAEAKGKRVVFINIDGAPLTDLFLFNYGTKQQVDAKSETAMAKLEEDLSQWLGLKKESESETGEDNPEVDQKAKPQSRPKSETKKKFPTRLVAAAACFVVAMVLLCLPKSTPRTGSIAGHEYVDLGLPSGTLWATCNVGASKPEEYGLYYQWGDTQGYSSDTSDGRYFDWKDGSGNVTYKWCNGTETSLTKYNTNSSYGTVDNKTVLDPEDDAAHVPLGGNWRMPTYAEWTELRENCTWTWTSDYNGTGVAGRIVTSNKDGYTDKSIFLPAAGFRGGDDLSDAGSFGYYWSSSLSSDDPSGAYYVIFYSGGVGRKYGGRCYGLSIRPVQE